MRLCSFIATPSAFWMSRFAVSAFHKYLKRASGKTIYATPLEFQHNKNLVSLLDRTVTTSVMFVTLLVLYRVVAYMLRHLWHHISALQLPPGLPVLSVTITYSLMSGQHLIVDVAMNICTLVVCFIVTRSVLVGKKVPANHARSYVKPSFVCSPSRPLFLMCLPAHFVEGNK